MRLLDPQAALSSHSGARSVARRRVHIHGHAYTAWHEPDLTDQWPHHPTQGEGVSPQVECTHVVRLCRLRRALGIIVVEFLRLWTSRSDRASLREGSHCRLAATGAATRAQLHAYPGGGSLRGLPPSVNPSGNNIHTHTQGYIPTTMNDERQGDLSPVHYHRVEALVIGGAAGKQLPYGIRTPHQ